MRPTPTQEPELTVYHFTQSLIALSFFDKDLAN
jgi:hypothetical protein